MSVNKVSHLTNATMHLNNPNKQMGTILIEVPADLGRAYSGYKRGGVIEASEKLRKELLSAGIWLFGIPFFNKLGNTICEKIFKLPMDIDYSSAKEGRDAIKDSLEYLKTGMNPKGLDVSDLTKYVGKINTDDIEKLAKKVKVSKQVVSIAALLLNCFLMGIALPKINQKMTKRKLEKSKKNQQDAMPKFDTLEEYQKKVKDKNNKKNVSFTGFAEKIGKLEDVFDKCTYGINNDNRIRLMSTDIPMIIGRCATARNKYEAIEIAFIDGASMYFYNYCKEHIEKLLQKFTSTPKTSSGICEYISKIDKNTLQEALNKLNNNTQAETTIKDLFGNATLDQKEICRELYNIGTYGKYSKINRFVKDENLRGIDDEVKIFLRKISEKFDKDNLDMDKIKDLAKRTNIKNTAFYGIGTVASIFGLGILIPKIGYAITRKLTGKTGFIAIDEEQNKENVKKS